MSQDFVLEEILEKVVKLQLEILTLSYVALLHD